MSVEEARSAARKLVGKFLAGTAKNSYIGKPLDPVPDAIRTERAGKAPRHWTVAVEWTLNGNLVDGPSVICVDLIEGSADWL